MSIEFNKVTWYSKLLALALFVALPFLGFGLGMKYESLKKEVWKAREIISVQKTGDKFATSTATSTLPLTDKGVLRGQVIIGPICPVEREGVPCEVPSETYTSRQVIIYKEDGKTEVGRQALSTKGEYQFELSPGVYLVTVRPQGIYEAPPERTLIKKGVTTELDFDIDTGIR